MATIPQRELRNDVSSVLRRAEHGERFIITVDGRPVAELGPLSKARGLGTPSRLAAIVSDTPVDPAWGPELHRLRADDRSASEETWSD
ncbi:MAG: type II toxin-antitoxin system prevent-host-death family antitoxin [Thermoleophilaceae bacterium]|nr:type II toxin-antitoxin system prevent-host-death family antitoxin [Thermoleophilaceae bacterium]